MQRPPLSCFSVRFLVLVLLSFWGWLPAQGQQSIIRHFAHGAVLTLNGDTVMGRVEFHQHDDRLVVFGSHGTVRAFSAASVSTFAVQGEQQYYLPYAGGLVNGSFLGKRPALTAKLPRYFRDSTTVFVFRSYPRRIGQDKRRHQQRQFFEQLSNGPYVLLRQQLLYNRMVDYFYLYTPKNQIVALVEPEKDVLTILSANARFIKAFARQHQLSFTDARHLAAIFTYANKLEKLPATLGPAKPLD